MFFFFFQELSQADISVLKKAELKERLGLIRKAFDKEVRDREAQANKIVGNLSIESMRHW